MKLLTKVLQRSLCENVGKILMKSRQRSLHELQQVLIRRSCENFADILEESLPDLVQNLVRRFCGDPGQNLSKKSLLEDLAGAMS